MITNSAPQWPFIIPVVRRYWYQTNQALCRTFCRHLHFAVIPFRVVFLHPPNKELWWLLFACRMVGLGGHTLYAKRSEEHEVQHCQPQRRGELQSSPQARFGVTFVLLLPQRRVSFRPTRVSPFVNKYFNPFHFWSLLHLNHFVYHSLQLCFFARHVSSKFVFAFSFFFCLRPRWNSYFSPGPGRRPKTTPNNILWFVRSPSPLSANNTNKTLLDTLIMMKTASKRRKNSPAATAAAAASKICKWGDRRQINKCRLQQGEALHCDPLINA